MRSVESLVESASERLVRRSYRLAVAESCTGGLLTARLTDRPGSSRFLMAGLVTYSNDAKQRLLGVPAETLAAYGAVSGPVATAMAAGARAVVDAEAAVAVTGVAGPDGGTAAKPVGTVWVAAVLPDRSAVREFHFDGSRDSIRHASVRAALEMLDDLLLGEP